MAPKKRKSIKSRPAHLSGARIVLNFILGCALAGALGVIALFLLVDSKVRTRLELRGTTDASAILSDVFRVDRRTRLAPEYLREELIARNYTPVDGAPSHPGEFRLTTEQLDLFTRPFPLQDGTRNESRLFQIPLQKTGATQPERPREAVMLEPRVVSYLGAENVRAASFTRLKDIPDIMKQSVLAVEDARFYDHFGVDLLGIGRALVANVRAGAFIQGGSTITQQLAKNLFFTSRKTIGRKVLEALAAISLEQRKTKDEILEMYLNEVYLGQEGVIALHGVTEATKTYFGKSIADISIPEAALLAGIIKAPSLYSPSRQPKRALARRNVVLGVMQEAGIISGAEAFEGKNHPVKVRSGQARHVIAQHFVAAVKKELNHSFEVDAAALAGLTVHTGLDLSVQRCAETAVTEGMAWIEKSYPSTKRKQGPLESGLVAIEPFSGKVRAWVGGRAFLSNQFDHAGQGKRQIGSTIKPFLYLTALDRNLNRYKAANPTSIIADEPITIELPSQDTWDPENYDKEFKGDVTLRYALENSLNLSAVYLSQRVGLPAFSNVLRRFQVADSILEVPSLALGSLETTLLQLTASYAALSNNGVYVRPRIFTAAMSGGGDTLAHTSPEESVAADENAVFVLTDILAGVINRGTGRVIRSMGIQSPAAGKTGTSNEARDAWFVGYTPTLATGVWVGFDDNSKIGLTGGALAAPIWGRFMKCIEGFEEQYSFIPPAGVVFLDIDSKTGQRATKNCYSDDVVREVFVTGTEPKVSCQLHGRYGEPTPLPEETSPTPRRRRSAELWDLIFGGAE